MLARKHSSYFVICAISHILNFLQSDIVVGVKLSRYEARNIPRGEYSLVRRIHGNGKTIINPKNQYVEKLKLLVCNYC